MTNLRNFWDARSKKMVLFDLNPRESWNWVSSQIMKFLLALTSSQIHSNMKQKVWNKKKYDLMTMILIRIILIFPSRIRITRISCHPRKLWPAKLIRQRWSDTAAEKKSGTRMFNFWYLHVILVHCCWWCCFCCKCRNQKNQKNAEWCTSAYRMYKKTEIKSSSKLKDNPVYFSF